MGWGERGSFWGAIGLGGGSSNELFMHRVMKSTREGLEKKFGMWHIWYLQTNLVCVKLRLYFHWSGA